MLYFHRRNRKLYRITALGNYKGKLAERIRVGMRLEELQKAEPSFRCNEEWKGEMGQECWESHRIPGVWVWMADGRRQRISGIDIFIPELEREDWYEGKW